jgi:hypothetical protein
MKGLSAPQISDTYIAEIALKREQENQQEEYIIDCNLSISFQH